MAEEKEPKADAKPAKKAKKTAVPEVPEPEQPLPTAAEIRAAKKAELVEWSERYGLSQEGKVDDLRRRLRAFVEKKAAKEAPPKEEKPAPPKEEKKPKEKPKEKPPRTAGEAEARASSEATPRVPICEECGAAQVPPPRVVPVSEVRRRVAKAAGRPV